MKSFQTDRRNLLRLGGAGLAAALPSVGFSAPTHEAGKAAGLFDVRTYGAADDGKTLEKPALKNNKKKNEAAGGGTVLFPASTYLSFSIHLRSLVHLHLLGGATILAADSPLPGATGGYQGGSYDAAEPKTAWDAYQDFGHNHWHNSLLWGENLHDISITGAGLLWGKGLSNGRGSKGNETPFVAEQPGVGNKTIALKNCRNVLLRDFSILKGGHFGLLLTGVDNVIIDGLTIDTDRDGMDLDCCQNARVSNCTVNSPWDDGICPKSSFALGYARPTRNLTIADCFVSGSYQLGSVLDGTFRKYAPEDRIPRTGRIKCGTESNGGFLNIAIANCIFEGCQGLALESVDGALIEDIAITNITMRDLASGPLFFRLGARLRGPRESTHVGTLKRVLVSNLVCHNAPQKYSGILSGIPGSMIEDVKLSNIYIESVGGADASMAAREVPELEARYPEPNMFGATPAYGLYIRHARNLEMSHVELAAATPDARPAIYLEDVEAADCFAITAQRGASAKAFALHDIRDLRIGWSRAAPDTTLSSAKQQSL